MAVGWRTLRGLRVRFLSSLSLFALQRVNFQQSIVVSGVKTVTAPRPILRIADQAPFHWIEVHVLELFCFLPRTPDIEIVKTRLPEVRAGFRNCKSQTKLIWRSLPRVLVPQ